MSVTVVQSNRGRRPSDGDRPSNEIPYLLIANGGEEEEDALSALRATAPGTLGSLKLTQCQITGYLQNGWYEGTATYGSPSAQKDTNESTFNFDTTGGQFKITQSKETVQCLCAGGVTGPDFHGAIGANGDTVEGVEITIPQYAFSETHYLADADVTETYRGVLYTLTGTVNDADFKGCHAGECLFLGARGSKRGRGDWEITFLFAGSKNVTGLAIGDIIGINKKGWEYLWVRYVPIPVDLGGGLGKVLSQAPQVVSVEKVYDLADLSLLDIGT